MAHRTTWLRPDFMGDLIPIIAADGINPIVPGFNRSEKSVRPGFDKLESRFYLAFDRADADKVKHLGDVVENGNEIAIVTDSVAEEKMQSRITELGIKPLSVIRFI